MISAELLELLEHMVSKSPCPRCAEMSLSLSFQLVAKPIGEFSLSGQQMKFSAVRYPIVTCKTEGCDFRARGEYPA